MNTITSHAFQGPYIACSADGCGLREEAAVHALARVATLEKALKAALSVAEKPGAGDYNRALADVRAAVAEVLG